MMQFARLAVSLLFLLLTSVCARTEPVPAVSMEIDESLAAFDVSVQGDIIDLLIFDVDNKRSTFRHRRSLDAGRTWLPPSPIEVKTRDPYSHRPGIDPQIAASGDTVIAVWSTKGEGEYTGWAGLLELAISQDGGKTWQAGPNPAVDSVYPHNFLDLVVDANGRFLLFWNHGMEGGFRTASSDDGGMTWSPPQMLDAQSCACCWNKALVDEGGFVYALYRDRDPRDMGLFVRTPEGQWKQGSTVGAFNWQIDACPHVGGGLATSVSGGEHYLHAVVWTGEEKQAGVYTLRSSDNGNTWSVPRRMGTRWAKHASIAAVGSLLVAVWDDRDGEKQGIYYAQSRDKGLSWSEPTVLSTQVSQATHPVAFHTRDRVLVFWSEQSDGTCGDAPCPRMLHYVVF